MKILALVMLITVGAASNLAEVTHAARAGDEGSSGAAASVVAAPNADATTYKLSGNRGVQPRAIHDDGLRTYIQWGQAQSIPAVFGVDEHGREQLVNGFMRDGTFTIDRVYARLVFRIDDASASARRSVRKK